MQKHVWMNVRRKIELTFGGRAARGWWKKRVEMKKMKIVAFCSCFKGKALLQWGEEEEEEEEDKNCERRHLNGHGKKLEKMRIES